MTVTVTYKDVRGMYIRVRRDRTVAVTVPRGTPEAVWRAFVASRQAWMEAALAGIPEFHPAEWTDGEVHWLLGRRVTLRVRRGRENACRIEGDEAVMTVRSTRTHRMALAAACWERELTAVIADLIDLWAPRMGVHPAGFTVRLLRSRWGSCQVRTGALTFSLDLSAKPVACIESVVVHELNHLIEPSHSPRFHALMTRWLPDWKARKRRLESFPREFS